MQTQEIRFIRKLGTQRSLDLEVDHKDHNFYAEGVVVSNSHAVAYAGLSAITTYLKFKYPKEFYLSLLKMTKNEPDPISEISKAQKELRHFNIRLLPPHILKSDLDFTIEKDDIRFGLLSVKGISDKSIEKLNNFKHQYSNKFEIFQGAEDAGLSVGVLCALIQAGALEGFKNSRSRLVLEAQLWNLFTEKEKVAAFKVAEECGYDVFKVVEKLKTFLDDKGKPIIKDSRFQTIMKNYVPHREVYDKNNQYRDFANWYYERQLLGYVYHTTLKNIFGDKIPDLIYLKDVEEQDEGEYIKTIGVVKEVKSGTSKNGKGTKYVKFTLEDETSSGYNMMIFNDRIQKVEVDNGGTLPKEGNIVFVRGRKKGDSIFADDIYVQDKQICTNLGQLTRLKKKKEKETLDSENKIKENNNHVDVLEKSSE